MTYRGFSMHYFLLLKPEKLCEDVYYYHSHFMAKDRFLRMVSNLLRSRTRTQQLRTELKLSTLRPEFFPPSLTIF